jgi:ectoine hydroxylase-related dioxygenase (phytanoyl-CoA dioxygenase family)
MSLQRQYEDDGVVLLKDALDPPSLAAAQGAYDWSLANPGPGASRLPQKGEGVFLNDLFNPRCLEGYREMLEASPLPALIADIWGTDDVWFFYEQVFLKEGGETRRTPWHQDSSYLAIAGDHLAVAWITFDPTTEQESLEFVRGSHKGTLYNGSRFDPNDDTLPTHPNSPLPRLPDIEAARGGWDIVSFATQPGDVVLFHPKTLHGGAPTHSQTRRRTLTLRFFGEDAVYDPRDGGAGPNVKGFHARMQAGDPFRDPAFLKLR